MLETIIAILTNPVVVILVIVVVLAAFSWLHHAQALAGRIQWRRPLNFELIRAALGRGAETGRAIHVSPGAGTIGNRATMAETVVGLLAAEAASNGAPILVSSGDAVAHLALRGTMRQVYQRAGQAQDYAPGNVQLLAHQDPAAYATGVMTLYGRQRLEASQLLGSFSQEFLLCGEDGALRGVPQVAGATSSAALPVMLLSADQTLLGEEIFAAEAYLSDDRTSDARLRTQDTLRTLVILMIVVGLLYSLAQPFLDLPALPGI